MNKHTGVAVMVGLMALAAQARPTLQPEVKEYVEAVGSADYSKAPVVYLDQEQCRIGADEIPSSGTRTAWKVGARMPQQNVAAAGVYVAIVDSELGKMLVADMGLDVPAKKQGYAIRVVGARAAIVGADAVGALYGAVTFRQMAAQGGMVASATVRDWPDLLYRGGPSYGRGIAFLANGEKTREGRLAAYKAGVDWTFRHKLNVVCDYFGVHPTSDEKTFAFCREVNEYAQARGIHPVDYGSTAIYFNFHKPKDVEFQKWPCVKSHEGWGEDKYYCWSDDEATEAAAEYYADYMEKAGATKGIFVIHPVDGGTWTDPETWSRRCARCKAKWADGDRWKASINQFDIWSRVLKRRLPEARVGSCIYPYTFNALLTPEAKRTAKWKESMPEYWSKLSSGLADDRFFFSSWIAGTRVTEELRKLVPTRSVHFSDTYPMSAGIFNAYHRKIGATYEPQVENLFWTQGSDCRAHWESLFLIAEYAWNVKAAGAEPYDGGTYYDPLVDHVGTEPIQKDVLPRVCRTYWGEKLAPYMLRTMTSGVMPGYIADPAGSVKYWNSTRRDPLYDPVVKGDHGLTAVKRLPTIDDTPAFMGAQVEAADRAVAATQEALAHLGGLDRFKRKYFMWLAKFAPEWRAAARAKHNARVADELVAAGHNAEAVAVLEKGLAALKADYDFSVANMKALEKEPDMRDWTMPWRITREKMEKLLKDALVSAKIVLKPRRIGREIRVGVVKGCGATGVKAYLDGFANVNAFLIDDVSLAELDRCDCVFVSAKAYDKQSYFRNLKAYAEKAAGGVYIEAYLCGHERFDRKTPFPEIVETSPKRHDNFNRTVKTADGRQRQTMYLDYFELKPGPKGEVCATSLDGKPVCVRGEAGLGKVFFNGTFNLGAAKGTWSEESVRLFGFNAEMTRTAIEYFTGIRLVEKSALGR